MFLETTSHCTVLIFTNFMSGRQEHTWEAKSPHTALQKPIQKILGYRFDIQKEKKLQWYLYCLLYIQCHCPCVYIVPLQIHHLCNVTMYIDVFQEMKTEGSYQLRGFIGA